MRFKSELPNNLGHIGDEWRKGLGEGSFKDSVSDLTLVIARPDGNSEVVRRDVGPAVEELPGIQTTLSFTDAHFRRTFEIAENSVVEHGLTVRTGTGNATTVLDMVRNAQYEAGKKPPLQTLKRSMTHIDIATRSDAPKPNTPDLLYTVVYGKQTEWFDGTFFLPLTPGHNAFSYLSMLACMHIFLKPRTLFQKPYIAEDDNLLTFTRYDTHRMPSIDLRKDARFLLRDAVSVKEASSF